MKKLYTLLALLTLGFVIACDDGDEEVVITDIAGDRVAEAVTLTEGVHGDEINVTLAEYNSALAQTTTEVESYVEERIVYVLTFDTDDGIHYAIVDYFFTYDASELGAEPATDDYEITVYDNEEDLNEARSEAMDGFNTFLETTQQLADALEDQGEEIEFSLDELEGEFDSAQIQDFLEQAEADEDIE